MKVVTMPLFYTNCYLIQTATGWILVDAGTRSQAKSFLRRLGKLGIQPSDIKLIIITHAHFDHVGSLASIKSLCNCPVLAHPLEARLIETGEVVIPPGTNALGKLVSWLGRHNIRSLRFPKTRVEFTTDQELDLTPYGVAAKVVPTPGHTPGSLSVLLEDGQAIVGDLAMSYGPGSNFPIFAEQPEKITASWDLLIKQGASIFYPAHGRKVPVTRLRGIEK
ncbi:MAG: MBL fold metallo-hydrolase [Syntrophomonadaceae bacterium]|jgi:hydroxyacylglutathione hydrolase